ncbi:MAG: GNAT family N-acetyltransferase [Clostridia bacterium]|nr:GNAT family N-acetyltransferase [Clostridia bacterium]
MDFTIERITENNYCEFKDMVFWRINGSERDPLKTDVSPQVAQELKNPNLWVFAARCGGRFTGWISLVYIPKIGPWGGHGHVYVDELWVAPQFRRKGIARGLMAEADSLKASLNASGIRLYVNINNPGAKALYASCGCRESGTADFMEK